mgnify:FL=1
MESKSLILPEASNFSTAAFIFGSPWTLALAWLLVINLVTFLVFGFDKLKAKWKEKHEAARRVPEKTLLLLSAVGGSLGALLGMKVFHHKTLHKTFRFGVPLILILQLVVAGGIWVYLHSNW